MPGTRRRRQRPPHSGLRHDADEVEPQAGREPLPDRRGRGKCGQRARHRGRTRRASIASVPVAGARGAASANLDRRPACRHGSRATRSTSPPSAERTRRPSTATPPHQPGGDRVLGRRPRSCRGSASDSTRWRVSHMALTGGLPAPSSGRRRGQSEREESSVDASSRSAAAATSNASSAARRTDGANEREGCGDAHVALVLDARRRGGGCSNPCARAKP